MNKREKFNKRKFDFNPVQILGREAQNLIKTSPSYFLFKKRRDFKKNYLKSLIYSKTP